MDGPPGRSGTTTRADAGAAALGLVALAAALVADPGDASAAAGQVWPPFVLVAGLLLIGLAADGDGLFEAAGQRLAGLPAGGRTFYAGAVVVIGAVTAVLNLDTAVAFLTPVLVHAARRRGGGEAPLLYGCLLLANAGSLILPGANLTNLIVLGHLHLSGAAYLADMWAPALAALTVTAGVVAVLERRGLRPVARRAADPSDVGATDDAPPPVRPGRGAGAAGVVLATVLVLVLPDPAPAVAAVGVAVTAWRAAAGRGTVRRAVDAVGAPLLVGLFGVAVALGTLGRAWSGPSDLLAHLGTWGTGVLAAATAVGVNNLPGAALLAARTPPRPFALLVGLDLGPNLVVTGSLAWFLWLRVARRSGARPSLRRASRLGVVAVPLSMAAALAILTARGLH